MNALSHLPLWAQAPTRQFLEQSKVDGTQSRPMDPDSFVESFNQGAGVVLLTACDEIAREDQALDQPGVVSRNGAMIYFDGDPGDSKSDLTAVVTGRRKGIEYVTYLCSQANGAGFSLLKMANDDGSIEVHGCQADRHGNGFLLAGDI